MNKEGKNNRFIIFIVGIILTISAILPLTGCDGSFNTLNGGLITSGYRRPIIHSRGHSRGHGHGYVYNRHGGGRKKHR